MKKECNSAPRQYVKDKKYEKVSLILGKLISLHLNFPTIARLFSQITVLSVWLKAITISSVTLDR